jgi:NodT family efflux transporter outer membrane factor (OMF) lipoprotein
VLLAGCTTVGPDYRAPAVAVPERFSEAAPGQESVGDAELAAWWRRFGDPLLDSLVARALAGNLDVQSAAARIREARALEIAAGARGRPQVAAEASVTRQRISEHAIPAPPGSGDSGDNAGFGLPGSEFTTWRAGFDASWEIDLFGGARRGREAARARTGAAHWSSRDVEVITAAEVARAYLELRTVQQQIANAEAELARMRRLESIVGARVRGGLAGGLELEQQRSERSLAAAQIPELRAQERAHVHALGVLAGSTPDALAAELSAPAALPSATPAIPAGLPSDLLRRRPDIRVAERALAAATADIGVAVADLYPRFSLTAAPGLVSTALASLLEWGSRSFTLGAGVAWPLLDSGRTRANIAVADARQEQALIAYRKTVLAALQDVEDALGNHAGDRERLQRLDQAWRSAAAAERLARTRHRGGLTDYTAVLAAQQRRLELEKRMIETRGALARDIVALYKALGGGWTDAGERT